MPWYDQLASSLITGYGYADQLKKLQEMGTAAQTGAETLGKELQTGAQFKPFTVTSGTGATSGWTADGNLMTNLSPQEQALQQQMMTGASGLFQQALGDTSGREADIYQRMRAMQTPEEQRQQLGLENRLAAQGRLGVQTAQYGGTPEQLAMAKAQEEAKNAAALGAMQQAQAEQLQQYNMGTGMLGSSYTPQQQLMNVLGQGSNLAQLAQQGQLTGLGYRGDLGMAGLDAYLQSQLGAGNLAGQGLSALAGLFAPRSSTVSIDGKTISTSDPSFLEGLYDAGTGIWDWLTGDNAANVDTNLVTGLPTDAPSTVYSTGTGQG